MKKMVHTGLKISHQDWNQAVAHLVETLAVFRVPTKEREELLSAVASLRDQVVGQ
jgi:hypothetical protein